MRYRARSQLLDDLYLMVRNSEHYNGPQHEITQLARKIVAIAEEKLEQLNTPIESAASGGDVGESSSASAETAPPRGIMDQLEEEAIKQWAQNKKNYGARGAVARSIDNLTAGGKNSQSMKQYSSPPPSSTVAKALVSSPPPQAPRTILPGEIPLSRLNSDAVNPDGDDDSSGDEEVLSSSKEKK